MYSELVLLSVFLEFEQSQSSYVPLFPVSVGGAQSKRHSLSQIMYKSVLWLNVYWETIDSRAFHNRGVSGSLDTLGSLEDAFHALLLSSTIFIWCLVTESAATWCFPQLSACHLTVSVLHWSLHWGFCGFCPAGSALCSVCATILRV